MDSPRAEKVPGHNLRILLTTRTTRQTRSVMEEDNENGHERPRRAAAKQGQPMRRSTRERKYIKTSLEDPDEYEDEDEDEDEEMNLTRRSGRNSNHVSEEIPDAEYKEEDEEEAILDEPESGIENEEAPEEYNEESNEEEEEDDVTDEDEFVAIEDEIEEDYGATRNNTRSSTLKKQLPSTSKRKLPSRSTRARRKSTEDSEDMEAMETSVDDFDFEDGGTRKSNRTRKTTNFFT